MTSPAFSVVIPTYKRAHLIERAVRSVLAQSISDFEVLVIDDCSHDSTAEVVRGIADPRVEYIQRERNGGAAAARNTGITRARGRLIAFLDSDDEWLPHMLAHQARFLDELGDHFGMVHGARIEVDGPTKELVSATGITVRGGIKGIEDLLIDNRVTPSCTIVRREVFGEVGMLDEDLASGEFLGVCVRMLQRDIGIGFTREPLVRRFRQPGGLGASAERDIASIDKLHDRFRDVYASSSRLRAHYHGQRALLLLQSRGRQAAFDDALAAVRAGASADLLFRIGVGLVGGFAAIGHVSAARRELRRRLQRGR